MTFLSLIIFSLMTSIPSMSAALENALCVQTFNVYATAYASKVDQRMARIPAEIVKDPKCDILGIQELWKHSTYNEFATELKKSGYNYYRPDGERDDKKMTGLATFSLHPLSDSEADLFHVNNEDGILDGAREMLGVEKGYSITTVSAPAGKVYLVNTHTHPLSQEIRIAQMLQIVDFLWGSGKYAKHPTFLTADLNARPDFLELNILKDLLLFRDSYLEAKEPGGRPCTYCGTNPLSWQRGKSSVIDYVLVRNGTEESVVVQDTKVNLKGSPESPLSDHFGQRTVVTLKKAPALLNRDDSVVEARIARAKSTLKRAIKALKKAKEADFSETIAAAEAMLKNLSEEELAEELDTLFRTP